MANSFRYICQYIAVAAFFLISFSGPAQTPASGKSEEAPAMVSAFDRLIDSCEQLSERNFPRFLSCSQRAYGLALRLQDPSCEAIANFHLGYAFNALGQRDSAYRYLYTSRQLYQELKDDKGLYKTVQAMAGMYTDDANYRQSYALYQELIALSERLGDKQKLADAYIGIGMVFRHMNDISKAVTYTERALDICKRLKNYSGIESCYLNLGIYHSERGGNDEAMAYLERALQINTTTGQKLSRAQELNTIGSLCFDLENYNGALNYFRQTADLYRELNYMTGLISSNNNIGTTLMLMENYKVAKPYLIEAYFAARNTKGEAQNLLTSTYNLSELYEGMGDYKSALSYMDEYNTIRDSLYGVENTRNLAEIETRYETQKKEQQNRSLTLSNEQKQITIYVAAGACVLLLGLGLLAFVSYAQKKRANVELAEKNAIIEEKNHIVEQQHKDKMDSIIYAGRIQKAILPPDRLWKEILPESFVFYQPKDILSGDFYWISESEEHIFVAAADCTGHGVPGALMSIINSNLLNKAVREQEITDPAKILDAVNIWLTQTLHQTYQEAAMKDGMDISLCVLDKRSGELQFAGAHNGLYIVDGQSGALKEIAADKHPVGAFIEERLRPFTTQTHQLRPQETVYLFTDGYADQFGGEKGKKFKYKNLKALLLKLSTDTMSRQQQQVGQTINTWKGHYEQVDDMLVLGFRYKPN